MSFGILNQVKNARRVSVPLVAINTPDPGATAATLVSGINGDSVKIEWDIVRGVTPRGKAGEEWWAANKPEGFDATTGNPLALMVLAGKLPANALCLVHMANRWAADPSVIQGVWNLRDEFKQNRRMLVLLGPSHQLPAELAEDVVLFDEPLPSAEELAVIVETQHRNAGLECDEETIQKAVEALRGLSAFAAEQVTAMCLRKSGIDLPGLWSRKRQQIEQTPGLKVWQGGDDFSQIGGCDVVKGFLSRIMHGQNRPNAVVFVDEIEKALGGTGDTSGVTQDQLGCLLSYMQDHEAAGMIFVGPPGAAKSAIAKAAGAEGGIPTIQLDLGAAKGSLVGQSEQQLRQALKVVTAVSNGKSLWIATCNSIADLPPELRRRFTLGTFFFDLPTSDEREAIWDIWVKRYDLQNLGEDAPSDEGWTGAEIRQCCDIAWRLGCTLTEAAQFVVPVSRSAADKLARLREAASGRFLSASYPGVYEKDRKPALALTGRNIDLD